MKKTHIKKIRDSKKVVIILIQTFEKAKRLTS